MDDSYYRNKGLTCVTLYVDVCEGVNCNGHGDCNVVGVVPICVCNSGYTGANCEHGK